MKVPNFIKDIVSNRKKKAEEKIQKRYISRVLDSLPNKLELSRSQKQEIQDFYKGLIGKTIDLKSHQYFYSRTGIYSKLYVPTYLYHVELIGRANMMPYRDALADKNMCDILLPDIKHPRTFLKNQNGYYYIDNTPVTKEEAIRQCQNISGMIIKPSLNKHGNGVKSLEVTNGITNHDGATIEKVFNRYKKNFQIQERVKQHEKMSALNPTSVNTLRIVTYRSGMEVIVVYVVVRIGRSGQVVDNQSAGGICAAVEEAGRISKAGHGGYNEDNIDRTDTGVVLDGYEIPSYEKAIEAVKRQHYHLPFFDIVGWDVAIDKDGEPVLLEWNANVGLSQSAYGPGFGKYTERIIKELWPRKNTLYSEY